MYILHWMGRTSAVDSSKKKKKEFMQCRSLTAVQCAVSLIRSSSSYKRCIIQRKPNRTGVRNGDDILIHARDSTRAKSSHIQTTVYTALYWRAHLFDTPSTANESKNTSAVGKEERATAGSGDAVSGGASYEAPLPKMHLTDSTVKTSIVAKVRGGS